MLAHRIIGAPSGRPVLFLHPGNTTGDAWGDLIADLPGVRGICPDLPGFGGSRSTPLTDFADSADHLADLLRAERLGPLPVVGYSLGGYTGFMLALRHPDLVEKACLTSFQVMPLCGGWWIVPFLNVVSPLMTLQFMRKRAFRSLGVPQSGSWAVSPKSPCTAATLRQIGRLAVRFDVRGHVAQVEPPLLVLAGEEELPSILDSVRLIAGGAPRARGAIAPGGHGWPATHADLFAKVVHAWLRDDPLPEVLRHV
ncbi:hypothetical protein JANAI62_29150 [Jannaschia pagri]|uniref:AB hydrolase-1 domain-containing protein n=1 Tax=Jannaschia pagri TaxID=2829797 RepID=A0ABQ4NPE7_9RHOB|nr:MULTISPECIES: alpha/beta hydrolase [unclassified Jannaschia]GIT92457.1 hypothetical protein JANAI61_29150 [Jannaschia sp. AI_61]GIT96292.1 hypothetical protein JANAI62_29150 [Jannaschia sp. AI_62]